MPIFDIFDVLPDLTKVDTNFPLLPVGLYTFKVSEITEKITESNNGVLLTIKLSLEQNGVIDVNGNPVNLGFPVYDRLFIASHGAVSKEGKPLTNDGVAKRIAMFQDAVGHRSAKFNTDDYIGKEIQAKVKIRHDKTEQFPDQNEISTYVKKS